MERPAEPLLVLCAASNLGVMEAIRADYEREFGAVVQLQYGASQTLLAGLDVSRTGDVYLPADESYLATAAGRGLIGETFSLGRMKAVVAVAKGNPKGIHKLDDLLRTDVRVAQASPDSAAIGKLTRAALESQSLWEPLAAHTKVFKTNVNEVANDVKIGAVDAGIVFNVVLHDYDALEPVELPELASAQATVAAAVLRTSRHADRALHFARYLAASDRGQQRYREFGFAVDNSEPWTNATKSPATTVESSSPGAMEQPMP